MFEKLVKLLCEPLCREHCIECVLRYDADACLKHVIERMARHLVLNGVTFKRYGKWKLLRGGRGTCDQCNRTQENVWDMDNWQRFCGCCGAEMKEAYSEHS